MRTPSGVIIFIAILLAIDTYVYSVIRSLSTTATPKTKLLVTVIYWSITALTIAGFLLFVYTSPEFLGKKARTYIFSVIIGLFLAKVTTSVFFLVDDIRRLIQWGVGKLYFSNAEGDTISQDGISRSVFLSWLGIAAGSSLFGTLLYGFRNQYNYQVSKIKLKYPNLPAGFKGMKIVQISDVHSGTFMNQLAVEKGIEKIMNQKADLILFTGDLVNDKASEMKDYKAIFSKLKAPLGVYSVLGNHDYGDYMQWPQDGLTKAQNLQKLKALQAEMGWQLLMNEHVILEIGGDEIALLGIENWGAKAKFPKYGRMDLAYPGTEKYSFKILMSHDPSHWDAQVKPEYPDIDLTLSGHTHGMQFGVEIPGFKWSPVQYVYKQWAGLYEEGNQKLYVNRGFGCIGYPGRVGILPEITVIELE